MEFSFERCMGCSAKLFEDNVKVIRILDPGRMRFALKEPWPTALLAFRRWRAQVLGKVRLTTPRGAP